MKPGAFGLLLLAGVVSGCSSSNNTTTPGTGGSNAGTAGTSAGGTGGTGGTTTGGTGGGSSGFTAVEPCATESDYATGTTINFGLIGGSYAYDPKCLQVPAGTSVTFSGDFSSHPLEPSTHRGELTGNPITAVSALPDGGTTKAFTFSTPGFYAYFCSYHGGSDTGGGMAGVIWVQ